MENPPAETLTIFLTWSLGIGMPGFALVYAKDKTAARILLDAYGGVAQPRPRLFDTYLPIPLRQDSGDNEPGVHFYAAGTVVDKQPGVVVIEDGYDASFDG